MRVAVFTDKPPERLESFIRAHIRRLQPDVIHIYRRGRAWYRSDGRPLAPFFHPGVHRAMAALSGGDRESVDRILSRIIPQPIANWEIRRLLRKEKIDVALAEFGPVGVLVMEHCARTDLPLVTHFHGHGVFKHRTRQKYESRYARLFDISSALIAVSHDMEKRLGEMGAPAEKIHYIPCGVDTRQFCGADPAHAQPTFVAVSNLLPIKAPHVTLLAMSRVVEACPEARLIYLGDGPLRESCLQLVKALCLENNVEFRGAVPNEAVPKVLKEGRCFVQHCMACESVEAEGGPSVSLLEACSAGLPAVVSRCGGLKDVVEDGQTGFLVDEGDIAAMAERMLKLAEDPSLATKMGNAARLRVEHHFSQAVLAPKLHNVLLDAAR
ncbi:MAG: glycosyltransferase family 4 protein [Candidatus Sumerlaeota bacterium]